MCYILFDDRFFYTKIPIEYKKNYIVFTLKNIIHDYLAISFVANLTKINKIINE